MMSYDTTKLIPFDLAKAKTPDNPGGLEVVDNFSREITILHVFDKTSKNGMIIVMTHLDKDGAHILDYYGIDGTIKNASVERKLMLVPRILEVEE